MYTKSLGYMKASLAVLLTFLLGIITTALVAKAYDQAAINTRAQKMVDAIKTNASKLDPVQVQPYYALVILNLRSLSMVLAEVDKQLATAADTSVLAGLLPPANSGTNNTNNNTNTNNSNTNNTNTNNNNNTNNSSNTTPPKNTNSGGDTTTPPKNTNTTPPKNTNSSGGGGSSGGGSSGGGSYGGGSSGGGSYGGGSSGGGSSGGGSSGGGSYGGGSSGGGSYGGGSSGGGSSGGGSSGGGSCKGNKPTGPGYRFIEYSTAVAGPSSGPNTTWMHSSSVPANYAPTCTWSCTREFEVSPDKSSCQPRPAGSGINIVLKDQHGKPVPGVRVRLTSFIASVTNQIGGGTSDASGRIPEFFGPNSDEGNLSSPHTNFYLFVESPGYFLKGGDCKTYSQILRGRCELNHDIVFKGGVANIEVIDVASTDPNIVFLHV